MIKGIVFDCFGVLTEDGWKAFLGTLNEEAREIARGLNHQYDAGLISLEKFLQGVKQATGRDYNVIESARSSEDSKNIQLISYIKQLKKNYKIGILSNVGTNWIKDYLLTADEQKLFDTMVFSYEVGVTKPDPKIYKIALNKLGIKAEEAIFTDDARHHCRAAEHLGIKAILYEDFPQFKKELETILNS